MRGCRGFLRRAEPSLFPISKRLLFFFLIIIAAHWLFFLYTTRLIHTDSSTLRSISGPVPEIPLVWRRLGCIDSSTLLNCIHKTPRRKVFSVLIDEYLSPWTPAVIGANPPGISSALLADLELRLRNMSTARIRCGHGGIVYRVLAHWDKTYRVPRLFKFLEMLAAAREQYPTMCDKSVEMYVNTADGPRVTVDSSSGDIAGIPLFGFRTGKSYIDIPVPDPVEHGAKVTGEGYVFRGSRVSWDKKICALVFRGSSSSMEEKRFGNWNLSPRVRIATISARFSTLLDAGITKWIKVASSSGVENILADANITTKEVLSLQEQLKYKFILDVDGGRGSSRKRWILFSGSVPFFQESSIFQWYEPLLVPWIHYVPVDKLFRDLLRHVLWARANNELAGNIARNAPNFAKRFLSEDAVLEYLAVLMLKYSALLRSSFDKDSSVIHPCAVAPDVRAGPMGCSSEWFSFNGKLKLPFGCRHKPQLPGKFVCHRPHPLTGKKQVKHGVYALYEDF